MSNTNSLNTPEPTTGPTQTCPDRHEDDAARDAAHLSLAVEQGIVG